MTQKRKGTAIYLNNSYIILLFVNFTTLPYFACTGEYLVKIWWKSDWHWARSSDFPQNAQKQPRPRRVRNTRGREKGEGPKGCPVTLTRWLRRMK
jgi:hypothetical protein